jgi:tetratricopeptide (TPR) repeat protein
MFGISKVGGGGFTAEDGECAERECRCMMGGMRVNKWIISLVFVLIAAITFATKQWLPDILDSAGTNKDSIQAITNIVTAVAGVAALAVPTLLALLLAFLLNRSGVPEPETPAALRQLRAPRTDFVGRKDELKKLRRSIRKGKVAGVVIQGMGGVGKSELALVLAQDQFKRYRDAHIFLDLKGFSDETALTTAQAMAHVIRSFHPTANLPEDESALGGMYRSVLDGKKALLVMDNVVDEGHLEPLIAPDGSLILATSRKHFELDRLFSMDLQTMEPVDARELLLAIAPRIGNEAEEIARLCGYLPMALRYVGSALAERPDLIPSGYVERLAGVEDRLKLVRESLGLSYELLSPKKQGMWRALAVFPDTFVAAAAEAVWEMEENAARDTLSELRAYSMVDWSRETDRYRLHDLARVFAVSRLEKAEEEGARRRHAGHYLNVIALANYLYLKGGDYVLSGLDLFDMERGNIEAGQAWLAANAEEDDAAATICSDYAGASSILELRLHPRERITWLKAALASAQRLNNREAEGRHQSGLGLAYVDLGDMQIAIDYHNRALGISREIGNRHGESVPLGNLGIAYTILGETQNAIDYYDQQLAIARLVKDRRGEGNALGNLGIAYRKMGEPKRAIEHHGEALNISREIGDRHGESADLGGLGNAYADVGETRRALKLHDQQLSITREIGDLKGEGNALGGLGNAYATLGQVRRAIKYYEKQLLIARGFGDHLGEGAALWNKALMLGRSGRNSKAIVNAEAALEIFEQIEAPNIGKVRDQLAEWREQG